MNLLLANQKASASPGDTKGMAVSRRAFLNKGYYAPLSDRINVLVGDYAERNEAAGLSVLDAGCGEGYYLQRLSESLAFPCESYGLDISKEAVKMGAGKYKDSRFLVASVHQNLPFASSSLDTVLNVFAPRNPKEFARILRMNGIALVVVPAEGHLTELHQTLGMAGIEGGKEQRTVEDFQEALVPVHTETLRYRRVLPPEDVLHLIEMTPTGWHLSEEARAKRNSLPALDMSFAFTLIVLRRASEAAPGNE